MVRLIRPSKRVGTCKRTGQYDETFVLPQENLGMTRTWIRVAVVLLLYLKAPLEAAENLRAASGGFTTAIHAVLWTAYEEKIFANMVSMWNI